MEREHVAPNCSATNRSCSSLRSPVYPEAISTLPFAKLWCALFFLMLISLGLDSAMGGLEAVIVGIMDEFQSWFKRKKINREIFTSIVIFLSFLISLINITQVTIACRTLFNAPCSPHTRFLSVQNKLCTYTKSAFFLFSLNCCSLACL